MSNHHWVSRCLRLVVGALIAVTAIAGAAVPAKAAQPPIEASEAELSPALACPTTFAHPEHPAVLLVHGTGSTPEESWSWNYTKVLPSLGFDACTIRLPEFALTDIQISSEYVVYAIRRMHELTGRVVSVMGHSQGNLQPRWAIKWWDDIPGIVDDYVSLAGPHHGIASTESCVTFHGCDEAAWQMRSASSFLAALNSGDETPDTVSYTSVYTQTDELVVPATTAVLDGAVNISIQSLCPGRYVEHGQMLHDAVAFAVVLDALTHVGPADPARIDPTSCSARSMPGVSGRDAFEGSSQASAGLGRIMAAERVPSEPPLRPYAASATSASATTSGETLTPQAGSSQDHAALPATGWDAARGLTLALACIAAALAVRRAARKKPSNQA